MGEVEANLGGLQASPHSPIGRGSRLKIGAVWVRVPLGAQIVSLTRATPRRSWPRVEARGELRPGRTEWTSVAPGR